MRLVDTRLGRVLSSASGSDRVCSGKEMCFYFLVIVVIVRVVAAPDASLIFGNQVVATVAGKSAAFYAIVGIDRYPATLGNHDVTPVS